MIPRPSEVCAKWLPELPCKIFFYSDDLITIVAAPVIVGWISTKILVKTFKNKETLKQTAPQPITFKLMPIVVGFGYTTVWLRYLWENPVLNVLFAVIALAGFVFAVGTMIASSLLYLTPHISNRYGKQWPKFLDFPYIILAFTGLARLVASSSFSGNRLLDTIGIVMIALALSVRLAKSIIEVFFDDWH